MMKPIVAKLKPAGGVSQLLHLSLLILLPLMLFVLVRLGDTFTKLAFSIVLLSKWRMLAVRPRFWPANVRANAVDIIVGISIVLFMTHAATQWWQLIWAILYGFWLIVLKPATGSVMTSVQAAIGQLCGLMAIYLTWSASPLFALVLSTGAVCYLAARHFFDTFDEPYARLLSYFWGYFGAALAWVLGHWLLFYRFISQPALLLCIIGVGLGGLYYFDHEDRLNVGLKRQFVFVMLAVILVIVTLSDWGDKVV
jgi:hypothetical protein